MFFFTIPKWRLLNSVPLIRMPFTDVNLPKLCRTDIPSPRPPTPIFVEVQLGPKWRTPRSNFWFSDLKVNPKQPPKTASRIQEKMNDIEHPQLEASVLDKSNCLGLRLVLGPQRCHSGCQLVVLLATENGWTSYGNHAWLTNAQHVVCVKLRNLRLLAA